MALGALGGMVVGPTLGLLGGGSRVSEMDVVRGSPATGQGQPPDGLLNPEAEDRPSPSVRAA